MRNIIYALLLILFAGCKNFLEDYSQDMVVPQTVTDLDETLLGSGYIQSKEVKYLYNGDVVWFLHILDDDVNAVMASSAQKGFQEMNPYYYGYFAWQYNVRIGYDATDQCDDSKMWNSLYEQINNVNIILDGLGDENIELKSEQDRLDAIRVEGECHFLRAQFYFALANVYGKPYNPADAADSLGVPIKLTPYVEHDESKDVQFERASIAENYEQIVRDLEASVDCFRRSPQTRSFYRASEEAALLLLSRVYLYMQDWDNAKKIAGEFLEKRSELSSYLLLDSTAVAISEESAEVVFSQGSLSLENYFSGLGGDFCVSDDLYSLYDTTDSRRDVYFSRQINTDSIALNRKYKMGTHRSYVSDFWLLRTAEGYLNMAEACAMTGDADGASDYLYGLRRFRIRNCKKINYSAADVVEAVREERRKELCFEGHRWFDLRRYSVCREAPFKKTIDHVFAVYNWNARNLLKFGEVYTLEEDDPAYTFAIPKDELDFDTGMPSNFRKSREYTRLIDPKELGEGGGDEGDEGDGGDEGGEGEENDR